MKKINKKIRLLFGFSLGLSVGFPLGVLGIIFGATKGITALLVCGIVLAVAGFYAMPILWVQYGEKRRDRNILNMIEHENIYTVSALAAQTGQPENVVRDKLKKMISSRELVGYLLVDDTLQLNTNAKQYAPNRVAKKCEGCGATMLSDGEKFVCEYCGSIANRE